MDRKNLLFIYNPRAGKGTMKNKLSDVVETFMQADFKVTIYATQRENEAEEIVENEGFMYDRIVCSGGDGTLHEVTQGLMRMDKDKRPVCGYIPTGTVNDFARGISLPMNIGQAAKVAAEDIVSPVDIGLFNGKCFTYVAAFGAFTSVAYETSQSVKNVFGKMAYLMEGIGQVANIPSYNVKITIDKKVIEDEFILGMISNAKTIGGFGFFKKTKVSLNDGIFEAIFVKRPKNPAEFSSVLNSLVTLTPNEQILGFYGKKFVIESDSEISFTLDGEDGGNYKKSVIECSHHAIKYVWGE